MKEQLESVVLQMYRAGLRCSEPVREFHPYCAQGTKRESVQSCQETRNTPEYAAPNDPTSED